MEDSFYASIKLVSGEEIFSIVCASEEEGEMILLLDNPVNIEPLISKVKGFTGYKISSWFNICDDELFAMKMDKVITMTEIKNPTIITAYKKFIRNSSQVPVNKDLGLISTVDDARSSLEKLYNIK
jgi:hypothetical protein